LARGGADHATLKTYEAIRVALRGDYIEGSALLDAIDPAMLRSSDREVLGFARRLASRLRVLNERQSLTVDIDTGLSDFDGKTAQGIIAKGDAALAASERLSAGK
jgi:hypothetical protein